MEAMRLAPLLPLACFALAACEGTPSMFIFDLSPPPDQALPPRDLALPDGGAAIFFNVTDDETGENIPARVLFTPIAPTPAPRFDRNNQGVLTNGEVGTSPDPGIIGSPEGVMLISGNARLSLLPGTYDLFITHGPEYEAWQQRITVTNAEPRMLDVPLRHSVDTAGWASADLHIHTMRSFDSKLQLDARVVSEVSVGVELLVSTDHNVFTDLQPDVEMFGYGSIARAFVGDEFNFYEGHGGAYPMPYDARAEFGGAPNLLLDWDHARLVRATEMFDYLHAMPQRPAVTVNHPRLLPDLGYFINVRWDPPMPLSSAGHFDGMEVLNAYTHTPTEIGQVLRDWFFLMNTGTRVTALGSSDTHRLRDVHAGFPRSWLRVPIDKPKDVSPEDLAEAIRRGRALASNGPFARLTVDGAEVGDLKKNLTGHATADVTVDAPDWIDVDKVRVFANGRLLAQRDVLRGKRPLFHETISLDLPKGDAWVVVQVGGSRPLRSDLIGDHGGGRVLPFAITNPVYIDGDGDGQWKPAFPTLQDADPGTIGPLNIRAPDPLGYPIDLRPAPLEVPQDCEPPLWTVPSTWVNP